MLIAFIIAAGLVLGGLTAILATRTILSVSFQNTRLKMSVAVIGCGLRYESEGNRVTLFCNRWSRNLNDRPSTSPAPKDKRIKQPLEKKPRPKSRRRLPFSTVVKIIKAGLLCVARILSCVQYDEGKLDLKPVIANPALAGMAFGWGQAVGGMFPGLRDVFEFAPSYGTATGTISGQAVFSIKNRLIVGVMWRLLRDLPIKELIKYRFSKKR